MENRENGFTVYAKAESIPELLNRPRSENADRIPEMEAIFSGHRFRKQDYSIWTL
jgi:hypothetical protein